MAPLLKGEAAFEGRATEPLPGARFLDPFLSIRHDTPLLDIADQIAGRLVSHRAEVESKHRSDAARRARTVAETIIANLALLVNSPGYATGDVLAIPTAKTKPTRYDPHDIGKHLWAQLSNELAEIGELVKHPYVFKQRVTTVEPSKSLLGRLRTVQLGEIDRRPDAETIWLSARTGEAGWHGQPAPKELIDYRDNADSRRYRREMFKINRFLNATELTFHGQAQGPIALRRTFLLRHRADPVSFGLNGRLAGGFWLTLPARDRGAIRLAGEPLADLDFKGMFIQLAYRSLDYELREDFDPYAVPGLEGHRDGAKLAMLSLLGRSKRMRALSPELRKALPDGWNVARLMAAVTDLHYDIQSLFGKDRAVDLMFQESEILIAALLRLIDENIPALPMHDGIMVPRSMKGAARQAMREISAKWLGGEPLPVTEKPVATLG